MKSRFKVGDIVTGIMSASERYVITTNGVHMKVTRVNEKHNNDIDVEIIGWEPKVERTMREYSIEVGCKYYDLEEKFFKKIDECYTVYDFAKDIISNNIETIWVYKADGHRRSVRQVRTFERTFESQVVCALQINGGEHMLNGTEALEQIRDWPLDAKVHLYDEDIFYPISYSSITEIDEYSSVRLMLFV